MVSLKQVRDMVKEAGYKPISSGHGSYHHPDTGHKLYLYNYVGGKQNWQRWGENGRLPQPPKVVAKRGGKWWQMMVIEGENGRFVEFPQIPQRLTVEEAGEIRDALNDVL